MIATAPRPTRSFIFKYNQAAYPHLESWVISTRTHGMTHSGNGNFVVDASDLRVSPYRVAQCAPKQITLWNPRTGGKRVYKSTGRMWVFKADEGGELTVLND